jgi:hypothetical protein
MAGGQVRLDARQESEARDLRQRRREPGAEPFELAGDESMSGQRGTLDGGGFVECISVGQHHTSSEILTGQDAPMQLLKFGTRLDAQLGNENLARALGRVQECVKGCVSRS